MKKILLPLSNLIGCILLVIFFAFLVAVIQFHYEDKRDALKKEEQDRAFIQMYEIDKLPNVCKLADGTYWKIIFKLKLPYLMQDGKKLLPVKVLSFDDYNDQYDGHNLTYVTDDGNVMLIMFYSDEKCSVIYTNKKYKNLVEDGVLTSKF